MKYTYVPIKRLLVPMPDDTILLNKYWIVLNGNIIFDKKKKPLQFQDKDKADKKAEEFPEATVIRIPKAFAPLPYRR